MKNDPAIPLPVAARPPPLDAKKKIPRIAWIGGAIGVGLLCLLCTCGGIGITSFIKTGSSPFTNPPLAGKWEPANEALFVGKRVIEFKADGTGESDMPGVMEAMFMPGGGPEKQDFKWRIEREAEAVLVLDTNGSKLLKTRQEESDTQIRNQNERARKQYEEAKKNGAFFLPATKESKGKEIGPFWLVQEPKEIKPLVLQGKRDHYHLAIKGNTLTMTPLTPGQPSFVLRRVK